MTAVLQALVEAAVDAVGATAGCVFASDVDEVLVVAVAGDVGGSFLGRRMPAGGTSAGFVLSSGQPMALTVRPDEPTASTLAALLVRQASSVLSVPCSSGSDVVGALELLDKAGGMFTIDDIELATLLARIAGAALTESGSGGPAVPDPAQLAAGLSRLADLDPARYSALAGVVEVLLDRG